MVLENSPLQKYLDEIGFTDFERGSSLKGHEKLNEGTLSILWTKVKGLLQSVLTWDTWESCYVLTPPRNDIEAFRKHYIAAVVDSEVLNDDDLNFLSNFDAELFKPGNPGTFGEPQKEMMFLISKRHGLLSFFVLIFSFLLATGNELSFPTFLVTVVTFCAIGIKTTSRYYFSICHQRNIGQLKSFMSHTKQLALLLRKSVKLIQEMELLSRGYTMVGPIIPSFIEGGDNMTGSVYPALRKAIIKNAENATTCLQRSAKELIFNFPLSLEYAGIFTYLSKGCEEIKPDYCAEELSLQTLKLMTSLVFGVQSEFLSRFLLCLSLEANGGNLTKLYRNLFANMNIMFGIPTRLLAESLTSLERSYKLHKSCCFTSNEQSVKHHAISNTKWTGLDVALHSLELHLQAGILRVQCLQQILGKSEIENEAKAAEATHISYSNLETTFHWLKIDLESALSCWEEGKKNLEKLLGKESPKKPDKETSSVVPNVILEKSTSHCEYHVNEEVVEVDRVYEAFSDPHEEDFYRHPILSVEDLEEEKNIAKDNKQLLQELKAVLFTKSKDPLISTAGYVQPVKAPVTLQTDATGLPHKGVDQSSMEVTRCNSQHRNDDLCVHKKHSSEAEAGQPPLPFTNVQSSVAATVAAAAVMRSKAMGLSEETFISDEESD